MKYKTNDPLKRVEQMAEQLRKNRRKDLQSLKRGQVGDIALRGRSVSPMFGGLQARGAQTLANLRTKRVEQQEESKEAASVATSTALLCGAPTAERRAPTALPTGVPTALLGV